MFPVHSKELSALGIKFLSPYLNAKHFHAAALLETCLKPSFQQLLFNTAPSPSFSTPATTFSSITSDKFSDLYTRLSQLSLPLARKDLQPYTHTYVRAS